MIRFENVTFSRGGHTVLKEVSFFIGSNETVAVLGSSGEENHPAETYSASSASRQWQNIH